jgi:hypothetical protein
MLREQAVNLEQPRERLLVLWETLKVLLTLRALLLTTFTVLCIDQVHDLLLVMLELWESPKIVLDRATIAPKPSISQVNSDKLGKLRMSGLWRRCEKAFDTRIRRTLQGVRKRE